MHWLTYIVPRLIYRTSTSYNHDIRVLEEFGKHKLLVNGSRQSGTYIESLWNHSAKAFGIKKIHPPQKILVLGVAGGSVIHLLHRTFPDASITGIDIDPEMIAIGKAYFGLGDIKKLSMVVADAKNYVTKGKVQMYDMVVIDLFFGREIPVFLETQNFLRNVKGMLTDRGLLWINYLREKEYSPKADKLAKTLSSIFQRMMHDDINNNRFFLAWN